VRRRGGAGTGAGSRAGGRGTGESLESVPGIGPSLAADLRRLGVRRVGDLKGRNAESLYGRLCRLEKASVDRCVLYAFRCAVYYASRSRHDPELLKWWNWKDGGKARRSPRR
jgi:hypothetical protein